MAVVFLIPNEADAPVNVSQAEPDSGDFKVIAAAANLEGVLTGLVTTEKAGTPNMSVDITSGTILYQGSTAIAFAGGNQAIGAAHATLPRFDLVYITSGGASGVLAGTAAAKPVFPAITSGKVVIAAVYVPPTVTTILNADIIDKRMVVLLQTENLLSATHTDTLAGTVVDGDTIIGNGTPKWSRLAISVPAANVRNVFGVDNGETRPSWKTALDGTNPTTIAVSDAAAPGTSLIFSHRDHQHASPATWVATAHNVLSAQHGDSTAAAVVRGDIMTGDSTPKWIRLAKGTAGSVLWGDGTDTAWTTSPRWAGYARVGSASAPSNTTAGDLTSIRLLVGTDTAFTAGHAALFNFGNFAFTADGSQAEFIGGKDTSAGVAFNDRVVNVVMDDASASGTQSVVSALRLQIAHSGAGTISNHRGLSIGLGVQAGVSTVTEGIIIGLSAAGFSGGSTGLVRGLNVANLGGANRTDAVAIDLTAQSGASGVNFAIRNAGNSVQTGYARFGAVTAPTNVTDGDVTAIRLLVGNAALGSGLVFQVTGDSGMSGRLRVGSTAAPTNTTAGDITGVRLILTDAALAAGVVLAATGNETITGYTRIGSATAPTNTTAGDLTAVRVLAGNATLASGVVLAAAGNETVTGYTRIGAATAPSNTTAGDLNAVRFVIGTDIALSQGDTTGFFGHFNFPNSTAWANTASGNVIAMNGGLGAMAGLNQDIRLWRANFVDATNSGTQARIRGLHFLMTKSGASTTTNAHGIGSSYVASAGTIGTARVFGAAAPDTSGGGLITTLIGYHVENQGTAQVTNATGIQIEAQSGGTTNIGLKNLSNSWQTQYARFGAQSAPTNVTDGDVTAIRLLAGNATLASGVVLAAAGNETITGYTRIGSASAASNTTAGDITAVRFLFGTDAALAESDTAGLFGWFNFPNSTAWAFGGNGSVIKVNGGIGAIAGGNVHTRLGHFAFTDASSSGTMAQTSVLYFQSLKTGASATTVMAGIYGQLVPSAGTVGTGYTMRAVAPVTTGSTVTTLTGITIDNMGTAQVTTAVGVDIAAQSGATNNIGLRNASNSQQAGYAQFRGVSLPANTTGGDVSCLRFTIAQADIAFAESTTSAVTFLMNIGGRSWAAEGQEVYWNVGKSAAAGIAFHNAAQKVQFVDNSTSGTQLAASLYRGLISHAGAGALTSAFGIVLQFNQSASAGTVTAASLFHALAPTIGATTTVTLLAGFRAANQGATNVTEAVGLLVDAQSGATTNNGIRNDDGRYVNANVVKPAAPPAGYTRMYSRLNADLAGATNFKTMVAIDENSFESSMSLRVRSMFPLPVTLTTATATMALASNNTTANVTAIIVSAPIKINKILYRSVSGGNAANVIRIAIYSENGTQKYIDVTDNVGAVGASDQTIDITDTTLFPGVYYVLVCHSTFSTTPNSILGYTQSGSLGAHIASEPDLGGTLTITAGAAPATIDPTALTAVAVGSTCPVLRFLGTALGS